jgi:K(+)-stimulated pyrophosphate-energized sodium pump
MDDWSLCLVNNRPLQNNVPVHLEFSPSSLMFPNFSAGAPLIETVPPFLLLTVAVGVLALIAAAIFRSLIASHSPGNAEMQKLSGKIRAGAMAFLTREYTVITPIVLAAAALLYVFLDRGEMETSIPYTAGSFLLGAFSSALAGFIGMRTATSANVRTAEAARTSVSNALRVSFLSGATMGLSVVGLALIGFTGALYVFLQNGLEMGQALNALTGFAFGASIVALFARVGGGIYTKAADVGADLVGKVEKGIPEDDPRNPAVIADNVGDNVGDVAGMGADLFESYVGAILAAMLIGLGVDWGEESGKAIVFPLLVSVIGVASTLLAMVFVRSKTAEGVQRALKMGLVASFVFLLIGSLILAQLWLPAEVAMPVFISVTAGLLAGVFVGWCTEFYTSHTYRPVKTLANSTQTGAATVLIEGLALGYASTALPLIVVSVAIGVAFVHAGIYGIAVGAVGMLATLGMVLAIDAFGPVADNAGGIAEMAKLPPEVRERTDALDAAGNTTAAIGKGFAIGMAGFMCLALFAAFKEEAGLRTIDASNPFTLIAILLGGMLPFLFSSLTMRAVGRAAMSMIEEVRRQFREIPGLMEGTAEGDTSTCVSIATAAAIREMILPGLLAVSSPIVIGILLGRQAVGGLLVGTLVTSILLGMSMANSGGAWDNAKKFIEAGNHGGKGSDRHKAAVVGDTVGDPFKDTSGPSLNILVKLMTMVALLTAGLFTASGILG